MTLNNHNYTAAVALGMFDGVHIGHVEVINSALEQERLNGLTPAVFTFRTLSKYSKSILPYQRKFTLLKAAGIKKIYSSDFESIKDLTAEEFVQQILIEKMNCGHVSCGWNFRFSKDAKADANDLKRICEARGIKVSIIKPIDINGLPASSTRIREAIQNGDISLANKMLGTDLTYELEVIEGAKLGRTLGAPTINQIIPADCVLPKFGVYKSRALVDVIHYTAVTNIGTKPTVDDGNTPIMETHIPGFNMEIYGQTVTVSLLEFIREEKKFTSLDELKAQIQLDVKKACKGR
ncbi:MAG: bifunctional riboflavin kinase/FAD synthetase [Oscillospiraceae bacterium]|nr:bifunctional riboflavin kinase/FAD synthetase [Oscillospiraceae bacterium]